MKKNFFIIVLCIFTLKGFAQQTFNTLHFKSYKETKWRPLDAHSERSDPEQVVSGTINISPKDSTISIIPEGQKESIYKIITIYPEEENKSVGDKITLIMCKDANQKNCSLRIVLNHYKTWRSLEAKIIYTANSIDYTCDYMKKISQ